MVLSFFLYYLGVFKDFFRISAVGYKGQKVEKLHFWPIFEISLIKSTHNCQIPKTSLTNCLAHLQFGQTKIFLVPWDALYIKKMV